MKVRLSLALVACVVGVSLVPGPAAADRPEVEELSPVGDQFLCGETLLTVTSGTVIVSTHVHELESGLFRVISISLARDIRATDEEGAIYHVVGPVHLNILTPNPEEETDEDIGFFHQQLRFIGPGGLLGTLDSRAQFKRNGDVVVRDNSTCEFVE
jgi:hypothetical protein